MRDNERKTFWSREEIEAVARAEGITPGMTFTGVSCMPDGMSRAELVTMLRTYILTPLDSGKPQTYTISTEKA